MTRRCYKSLIKVRRLFSVSSDNADFSCQFLNLVVVKMGLDLESFEPLLHILDLLYRHDEDQIDRFNHLYSVIIFMILAMITTAHHFIGEPIKCWSPTQFPESWTEYANTVCWISNTYFIPMSETDISTAPRSKIIYYQWVPLVLLLQALMFSAPWFLRMGLNRSAGLNINKIIKHCKSIEYKRQEYRDSVIHYLVDQIERYLKNSYPRSNSWWNRVKQTMANTGFLYGKRYGNYLVAVHLLTKLLYSANVVVQFLLMIEYLGTDTWLFGLESVKDLVNNGTVRESPSFPRVTLCDFNIRSLGHKIFEYTVQCTLPINLFNEKIFIFIWFWLVSLGIINILSLIWWAWKLFSMDRRSYIKTLLRDVDKYDKRGHKAKLSSFTKRYLKQDGYFILQMVDKNTHDVVVAEIVAKLWDNFAMVSDGRSIEA